MFKIDERWRMYNTNLDEVDVTNIREAIRTAYIGRTISGIERVAEGEVNLLPWDLNGLSVVEIGGGYGDYARKLCAKFEVKDYTLIDTKSMLRFARAFLSEYNVPCEFIDTESELPDRNWDVIISNICISEIPQFHAEQILEKIFKKVKYMAVIDVAMPWFDKLTSKYFRVTSRVCPECAQVNHYLYLGEKL